MNDYHTYTIDWSPDQLTWAVDGKVLRTVKKSDTYNETSSRYSYPVSPARVQLSLWPAGLPTNPEGTIEWAGGEISWNSQYMTNGYYYAQVDSLSIDCYDTPSDAKVSGDVSYVLNNKNADEGDFGAGHLGLWFRVRSRHTTMTNCENTPRRRRGCLVALV